MQSPATKSSKEELISIVTTSSGPRVRTVTRTKVVSTKISDVSNGESVTELLSWAKKMTEHYPGVHVTDFTSSWRDGLAFCAIIHKNRPDLLEFRSLKSKNAKENLELAFSLAEKTFGVTRLLDPEDVDTPTPDEKSLITYISSMYVALPETSTSYPFAEDDVNRKVDEYKDLARGLKLSLNVFLSKLKRLESSHTLKDLKSAMSELSKFKSDELPKRLRDKQKLNKFFQKLSHQCSYTNTPSDLEPPEIEKIWNDFSLTLQEKEKCIKEEISRLEKSQRSADKINKECRIIEDKIDEIERHIIKENKKMPKLSVTDAKRVSDQIEGDLKSIDEGLKILQTEIACLKDRNSTSSQDLTIRVECLKEKCQNIKVLFHTNISSFSNDKGLKSERHADVKSVRRKLGEDTVPDTSNKSTLFSLREKLDWIEKKIVRITELKFGTDYTSVKANYEKMRTEHKSVENFKHRERTLLCDKERTKSKNLKNSGDALMSTCSDDSEDIVNKFEELLRLSTKKVYDFDVLLEFAVSVNKELKWIAEKEETEMSRDCISKNINFPKIEHQQELLTSELENHEKIVNSIQNHGEKLLMQSHPASQTIEVLLNQLQSQWSWMLQLAFCFELQMKHARSYHEFYKVVRELDEFLKKIEEKLNTKFNKIGVSTDVIEKLLKQMYDIEKDIYHKSDCIDSIVKSSGEIVSLKERGVDLTKPVPVKSLCNYSTSSERICANDACFLKEIPVRNKWKVITPCGSEVVIPAICFVISPPNTEAIESGKRIKERYDNVVTLLMERKNKLRQNLILGTVKNVKSWDISYVRNIDANTRESIMSALRADVQSLAQEGLESETVQKLKQEISQCDAIFESMVKQLNEEKNDESGKHSKASGKKLSDNISRLQSVLIEKEKLLKTKVPAPLMFNLDALQTSIVEHKEFDIGLQSLEIEVLGIAESFDNKHTPSALRSKYQILKDMLDRVWDYSNLYVEKLKSIEVALNRLREATQVVSNLELKLASCSKMPSASSDLQKMHDELLTLQNEMQVAQIALDDVQDSSRKLRAIVLRINPKQTNFSDISKFDQDIKKLVTRCDNAKKQIIERLRSCDASSELLKTFKTKERQGSIWISETTVKMNSLKTMNKITTNETELSGEPVRKLISSISESRKSIEETNALGARYIREAQATVQENYKICEENANQLESWMKDIETKLANFEDIPEEIPLLQHQIAVGQVLREELESKQTLITSCLDEMRYLAQRGLEVLNKEEISFLQRNLISLQRRYDSLVNVCDRIVKSLTLSYDELQKLMSEIKTFKLWFKGVQEEYYRIENSIGVLEELKSKSEFLRRFTSDATAHQADIRFIIMAYERFFNEAQGYIGVVNDLRANLSRGLPALKFSKKEIKNEVEDLKTMFQNFLKNVNRLCDVHAIICNKYMFYSETVEKAQSWLNDVKKTTKNILEEPLILESSLLQQQMDKIKIINMEIISQCRLIETVRDSAKTLIDVSEKKNVRLVDVKTIESAVNSLQADYSSLAENVATRIKELHISVIHTQDIQGALDRALKFLDDAESTTKLQWKPASLVIEMLEKQLQEYKLLKSDADNERPNIELLVSSSKEVSNSKLEKRNESKVKEISQRFNNLCSLISKRGVILDEVLKDLQLFQKFVVELEEWFSESFDRIKNIEKIDSIGDDGTLSLSVIEHISNEYNTKKDFFGSLTKVGGSLTAKKEVGDKNVIKEKISSLEVQAKNLQELLNENRKLVNTRLEKLNAFETLKNEISDWLLKLEKKIGNLEPIFLEYDLLKKQSLEASVLLKETKEYASTIKKINEMSESCNPVSKKSVSKNSLHSFNDISPNQQQVSNINDRYTAIEKTICNQYEKITSITAELKEISSTLKEINVFIEEKEKLMPRDGIFFSKRDDENLQRLKEIEKVLLEKHSEVETLKKNIIAFLIKRKEIKGAKNLEEELHNFENKWDSFSTKLKRNIAFLEDLKEYHDLLIMIRNWLEQKDKMFHVLGPIATEPRMVYHQMQQVQVIKEEFTTQKSLDRLNELSKTIICYLQENSFQSATEKVAEGMNSIRQRWDDISRKLMERLANLEAACGVTKDFHRNLLALQENIQEMNDRFDSLDTSTLTTNVFLSSLSNLEEDMEKQRPQLSDAHVISEQLCDIMCDSTSNSEIKYKVDTLTKSYYSLRKKIDNKKAEIKSTLREDNDFYKSCENIILWLKSIKRTLTLSTDISKLLPEIENNEEFYKEVLNREHEIYLCLGKGSQMLTNITGNKEQELSLSSKLDFIKTSFEKIKKDTIDRRMLLQKCKMYVTSMDSFSSWLNETAEKCNRLELLTFKPHILSKELKISQAIKSEIAAHEKELHNIEEIVDDFKANENTNFSLKEKELFFKGVEILKMNWSKLNKRIENRVCLAEELLQLMSEFEEKLRESRYGVQRLEDKLGSHNLLGDLSTDPIILEKLKVLKEESIQMTEKITKLKSFSKLVIEKVGKNSDISDIQTSVDNIAARNQALRKEIEDKCYHLTASHKAITVFMDHLINFRSEFSAMSKSIDSTKVKDRAADIKILKEQLENIKNLKSQIIKMKTKTSSLLVTCGDISKEMKELDAKTYLDQVHNFNKEIKRLEEHISEKEISTETIIRDIERLYFDCNKTLQEVKSVVKKERTFEIVPGEVESIRSEQKKFKEWRVSEVAPLDRKVQEINKNGQRLIQIATNFIDTSDIEEKIEELNSSSNSLKESINEKEKKLDVALIKSGKFNEAISSVQKWLDETESMVFAQKNPSTDFKVLKAQLQEQKFLKKLLLDRQNSIVSLKDIGSELQEKSSGKINAEKNATLIKNISWRFEKLISTAEERMNALETLQPLARELHNVETPLTSTLVSTERKIASMTSIPVNQTKIKDMLIEYKDLSSELVGLEKSITNFSLISEKIEKFATITEFETVQQKLKSTNEKFSEIKKSHDSVGTMLKEAERGVKSFNTKYTKIISFVDEIDRQLNNYQVMNLHHDKLAVYIKDLQVLKEKLEQETENIERLRVFGEDIIQQTTGEDSINMKEKLDTLGVKFFGVRNQINNKLRAAETSFPVLETFSSSSSQLNIWMDSIENHLKNLDVCALEEQNETIKKFQESIPDYQRILQTINSNGQQLCEISGGAGSRSIKNQMSCANSRFEKICDHIQKKAERIFQLIQRRDNVINNIDELSDWFQDVERRVTKEEGLSSCEPNALITSLKEHKTLCDELSGQKMRVRDVITSTKKLMREKESKSDDFTDIHEKMEALKNHSTFISTICEKKLSALEQAIPFSKQFFEAHFNLENFLDQIEKNTELLETPALNRVQIKKQQVKNSELTESLKEHKPLLDKLNKTGYTLQKFCTNEESEKINTIMNSDNSKYNALRNVLRAHTSALEEALHATSRFSDKLEGMLSALTSTANELNNAEPISAHPEKIKEQINDNEVVLQDLDKRSVTLDAVKKTADNVITKAGSIDEPAIKDIQLKLERLNDLWTTIQSAAQKRGKSLEQALIAAEQFSKELTIVMKALKDLQQNLTSQQPPLVETSAVQKQQGALHVIKREIDETEPDVDHCRQTGKRLMELCGEHDKPDVKKHIKDLDSAWENVTSLYVKREKNLISAMEKSMLFHNTLKNLLEFLDVYEEKFRNLESVSSDIEQVKRQTSQLKVFKSEVDPYMVEIEVFNRQAEDLIELTSPDQSPFVRVPLNKINKRWNDLLSNIISRQKEMETIFLKLGEFQHALEEHLVWISKTDRTLDDLKPVLGDPQVLEVVLAKHKVISNDIHAHQSSIAAINKAGHEFIDYYCDTEDAESTNSKLKILHQQWQNLQNKSQSRYKEFEEALKEAQQFHHDIQNLLGWLNDVDAQLASSKPVGGLPDTAREQLNKFMDMYNELDTKRYKVDNILQKGQNFLKKSSESPSKFLQDNLLTLKQKYDNVLNKASDRKIKLDIALREATDFNESLQTFVEWLTNSEKYLTGLKPVSRYMNTVLNQIEAHRNFQKDLGINREIMLDLDKKGNHLKYFSCKQDVILIKNLLTSNQHRWEKIVSKAAERTRLLDQGYKEAKEFHDTWSSLSAWLSEAEKTLDSTTSGYIGNDPMKIKKMLSKHKEFQRTLGTKQITYDTTIKNGRTLKDKCNKQADDAKALQDMIDELKTRWNKICTHAVDRQRKLEEALLHSGQFKEAVSALKDWLDKAILNLSDTKPFLYHGDLDTVSTLIEKHKSFEEELKNRGQSLESVRKSAEDLKERSDPEEVENISCEMKDLYSKFEIISTLNLQRKNNLSQAYKLAEKLYKMVHVLLEWLSNAETKLRFLQTLPDDEETAIKQIAEYEEFLKEFEDHGKIKTETLDLARNILQKCHPDAISVIRHWITIIESRYEEISTLSRQRNQRLRDHLLALRKLNELLESLIEWLSKLESNFIRLEAQPLPDDLSTLEILIKEHQVCMNEVSTKQSDVEKISKSFFTYKRQQHKILNPSDVSEKSFRSSTPTSLKLSNQMIKFRESDIKHPRVKFLLDKWRSVWLLAMERQRRLEERRNFLLEKNKMKQFDFNDWRKRYLDCLNNKKSRILEQFKRIDRSNQGKVTKQEFIDGILQMRTKIWTSTSEMAKVADVFDKNGDGFIDSNEYMEALNIEESPKTDAEKILDEVQRQVAKCTCTQKFKVYEVGEGKYRFGDSEKLRLVRILRSTVMVRVGGGWVALDEFLVKNDPCRAKGRTNLELRENFVLAEGVSQSMTPFKTKQSPNASVLAQSGTVPSTGPITKIREISERSTPMRHSSNDNSNDISGISSSETERSAFTSPRTKDRTKSSCK